MEKPKIALVPPPPNLSLDVPQSLRCSDGSELRIGPNGITLIEARAVYLTQSREPVLALVWSCGRLTAVTGQ